MPSHFYAHVPPTAFEDVSEYEMAFSAVGQLFATLRKRLLPLKPKMTELAPLLLSGAPASRTQPLIDAASAALAECLKGEKEELVAAACQMLSSSLARSKAANAPSRGGAAGKAAGAAGKPVGNGGSGGAGGGGGAGGASAAARAKMEATERLMSELTSLAHELAVRKSAQESILHGRYETRRLAEPSSPLSHPRTQAPPSCGRACISDTASPDMIAASVSPCSTRRTRLPTSTSGETPRCCMAVRCCASSMRLVGWSAGERGRLRSLA